MAQEPWGDPVAPAARLLQHPLPVPAEIHLLESYGLTGFADRAAQIASSSSAISITP
jgi:hypothetical protein